MNAIALFSVIFTHMSHMFDFKRQLACNFSIVDERFSLDLLWFMHVYNLVVYPNIQMVGEVSLPADLPVSQQIQLRGPRVLLRVAVNRATINRQPLSKPSGTVKTALKNQIKSKKKIHIHKSWLTTTLPSGTVEVIGVTEKISNYLSQIFSCCYMFTRNFADTTSNTNIWTLFSLL